MIDLYKMRFLMKRIPKLKWDLAKEQAKATKITTTLTGMPRGSGNHSQVEDGAIRISIVKERYAEVKRELEAMKAELEPLINMLDNPFDRATMQLRYIDELSVDEIADAIHRSDRQVYRDLSRLERAIERMGQNL